MILDNILLALSNLKSNKMRSFLTMLGIMIGIASVIAIMTLGDALQNSTKDQLGENFSNIMIVEVIQKGQKDMYDNENYDRNLRWMRSSEYLTEKTFSSVQTRFSDKLKGVALTKNLGKMTMGKDKVTVRGVNALQYETNRNFKLVAGRNISNDEHARGKSVAMIPLKKAEQLYGSAEGALGKKFEGEINSKYYAFTVVGVYEKQKDSMVMSMMVDDGIKGNECFVPYMAVIDQPFDTMEYSFAEFIAKPDQDNDKLAKELVNYLNDTQFAASDAYKVDCYTISSAVDEVSQVLNITRSIFAAVAAISLLVGGIGVMNIMVVSITERTREIGTRKALGATNNNIRVQFLVESIIICLIGSLFGILLGLGLGSLISGFLGVSGTASLASIAGSVMFSMAFGVFFGYYPANKAAKLDPIVALRYE